jgi:hypothetical protein
MGYTTDFTGEFTLDRPLKPEHQKYLLLFSETRRMCRDPMKALMLPDPVRISAGVPLGIEAEYFTGGEGFAGQVKDNSVVNNNQPPRTQPGLWCQWIPNEEGTAISWDGAEKFYYFIEWIQYIVENFLNTWDYVLNGEVSWVGEDYEDKGIILIKDNAVTIYRESA